MRVWLAVDLEGGETVTFRVKSHRFLDRFTRASF